MIRPASAALATIVAGLLGSTALSQTHDVHSYARPREIAVTDVALDLTVDFAARRLIGRADLTIKRGALAEDSSPLILDARELSVDKIEAGPDVRALRPVAFDLTTPHAVLGSKLAIRVATTDKVVRVSYRTAPTASALQWLEPALTAGKKRPFLFSQSQAIHARSWIPIQDSPGVRVTYQATIRVPDGLVAAMSAEALPSKEEGVFRFRMNEPIPSYLIALAVGDLAFRPLGPRTGVYAEPSMLDKAAYEFADTEKMVESVEKRFGPYRWGRYDILVLPPSFPFGGMENPRLTFATPTVIAGDRSLVALIAHELAHSWSGNLVTNATWRDFWLNEGFTTYLEQRIVEDIYGKPRADVERVLGLRDLREEVATLPPGDQILHIDLSGRDPDDGVTRVPYEKGALFLTTIEKLVGRAQFDAFLLDYFNRRAFKSITTTDFLDDLNGGLLSKHPNAAKRIDLNAWLEKPGVPDGFAQPTAPALEAVDAARKAWLDGHVDAMGLGADRWSTQEWVHFLQGLPEKLAPARLAELDRAYGLTRRENSEIASQWLLLAIRHAYDGPDVESRLEAYLIGIGRRKLIVPLYKELIKTGPGQARARRVYAKARPGYHPIAVDTIDKIVGKP